MKSLSMERDTLIKVDKAFPWKIFRDKLESLYSKKPGRTSFYPSKCS